MHRKHIFRRFDLFLLRFSPAELSVHHRKRPKVLRRLREAAWRLLSSRKTRREGLEKDRRFSPLSIVRAYGKCPVFLSKKPSSSFCQRKRRSHGGLQAPGGLGGRGGGRRVRRHGALHAGARGKDGQWEERHGEQHPGPWHPAF